MIFVTNINSIWYKSALTSVKEVTLLHTKQCIANCNTAHTIVYLNLRSPISHVIAIEKNTNASNEIYRKIAFFYNIHSYIIVSKVATCKYPTLSFDKNWCNFGFGRNLLLIPFYCQTLRICFPFTFSPFRTS